MRRAYEGKLSRVVRERLYVYIKILKTKKSFWYMKWLDSLPASYLYQTGLWLRVGVLTLCPSSSQSGPTSMGSFRHKHMEILNLWRN